MSHNFTKYSSLSEALQESCGKFADSTALIEADREEEKQRWSYGQVRSEAQKVAAKLQSLGFHPGDRCAIIMSNQGKWLISATGIFWAGGVLVPLDFKLARQELFHLIEHCQPHCLIIEWQFWQQFMAGLSLPKKFPKTIVTEAPGDADLGGAQRWEENCESEFRFQPRGPEDVATIVYSSGTGGKMKGCMLTHYNYLSQLEQFHRRVGMRVTDRYFSLLPTNHAIDFVFGFLYPLNIGAQVVHQRTLRPQYIQPTFKKYRITITSLVPMLLKALKAKIEVKLPKLKGPRKTAFKFLVSLNRGLTRKPRQWISRLILKKIHDQFGGELRAIMTGGAFVDGELARFFYNLGFFVGIGYGLTEAGTAVSAPGWGTYHDDDVGKALDMTQIKIHNPDSRGVGEIWVRGPSVMQGYWQEPELTAETLVEGWLRTGDLGTLEADGTLKIVGRIKNMIVTEGGKNIYPEDVESYFSHLPECEEYCVFSKSYLWPNQPLSRDQLLIVLRPKEDFREGVVESVMMFNRQVPQYKRLSSYVIWPEEFPRTASLKIKRQNFAEEIRRKLDPDKVQELSA